MQDIEIKSKSREIGGRKPRLKKELNSIKEGDKQEVNSKGEDGNFSLATFQKRLDSNIDDESEESFRYKGNRKSNKSSLKINAKLLANKEINEEQIINR